MSEEYTCAMCGQVFTKAITDEEAMAETQSYWPGIEQQDCGIVCDDCWQKISPETHPQEYGGSLLAQICSAYAIPPSLLGETLHTNHMGGESQIEAYKRMLFQRRKRR